VTGRFNRTEACQRAAPGRDDFLMPQIPRNLKIVVIPPPVTSDAGHGLERFSGSAWARFYRRFLKPIPVFRSLAFFIWRNAYPVYLRIAASNSRDPDVEKWRRLVAYRDYRSDCVVPLADAAMVKTRLPRVIPAAYQHYILPQDGYFAPEVTVKTIPQGRVNGGSNLVLTKDALICHDLIDSKRDYTSEELHGRMVIDTASSRIRWLLRDAAPVEMPCAASFVDACAPNYAHWLTEVLPRLALYCGQPRFADVPIIVNAGLHKNILDSISYFAGEQREVITLPVGRAVVVDELHLTSVAGYVPFERRKGKLDGHAQGVFNPHAFQQIRACVLPHAETVQEGLIDKIYIRRNSGIRQVVNAAELEAALVARGYAVVEPEKLSFIEQVRMFAGARSIVGSSGAALANLIFAPESADIHVLIGRYADTSFWYWQNMASAVGANISYVFGEIESDGGIAIHADFRIDVAAFLKTLDSEADKP